jgi:hypothetical protein
MTHTVSDTTPFNYLLAALPKVLQERLRVGLEPVELVDGDLVFTSSRENEHVYFPVTARISLAHVRDDGRLVEISLVGNEGVIGIPLLLIGVIVPCRAVVVSAGSAYRLRAALFQQELNRGGPFPRELVRYAGHLVAQMERSDHCNRHGLDEPTSCQQCTHASACPQRDRPVAMAIGDRSLAPVTHASGATSGQESVSDGRRGDANLSASQ